MYFRRRLTFSVNLGPELLYSFRKGFGFLFPDDLSKLNPVMSPVTLGLLRRIWRTWSDEHTHHWRAEPCLWASNGGKPASDTAWPRYQAACTLGIFTCLAAEQELPFQVAIVDLTT